MPRVDRMNKQEMKALFVCLNRNILIKAKEFLDLKLKIWVYKGIQLIDLYPKIQFNVSEEL